MRVPPRSRVAFRFLSTTAILFAVLLHEKPASAALVISVQSTTIFAGGSGFVDVLISSTSSDSVDLVNYEFAITSVGSPSGTLQFIAPQVYSEHGFANYVFASDPSVDGIFENSLSNSVLEAGDFTENFSGVPLTTSTQLLLARLELEHVLGPGQTAALAAGEQFLVTLQNSAGTFFEDENGDALTIDVASFDPGTITVVAGATAVPEPSSLLLLAASGIGLITRKRRQDLQVASPAQAS